MFEILVGSQFSVNRVRLQKVLLPLILCNPLHFHEKPLRRTEASTKLYAVQHREGSVAKWEIKEKNPPFYFCTNGTNLLDAAKRKGKELPIFPCCYILRVIRCFLEGVHPEQPASTHSKSTWRRAFKCPPPHPPHHTRFWPSTGLTDS